MSVSLKFTSLSREVSLYLSESVPSSKPLVLSPRKTIGECRGDVKGKVVSCQFFGV